MRERCIVGSLELLVAKTYRKVVLKTFIIRSMLDSLASKYRFTLEKEQYIFLYTEIYSNLIKKKDMDKVIYYLINYLEIKYRKELEEDDVLMINRAIFSLYDELHQYKIVKWHVLDENVVVLLTKASTYYKP